MPTALPRPKTKLQRAKAVPRKEPPESGPVLVESPEALLEGVLGALPEAPAASNGLPEVVRRNRRERARRRMLDALRSLGDHAVPPRLREELRVLAERWARKGFADAFPEADDFEVRCADERAVLDAAARGDEEERFAAGERAYLREVEKKYGRVEIRGLQLSARVYQDLEIAYVPLHVEVPVEAFPIDLPAEKGTGKKSEGKKKADETEIAMQMVRALERQRMPVTRALKEHARLLLVGEPGSGKSTLLAYLATRAARGDLASEIGWEVDPVPFLVPVRSLLTAGMTVESLATAAGADPWLLESALERGRALLLVDGLDEARPEVASQFPQELTKVLDAYPDSRALVTTRPAGVPGEDASALVRCVRLRLAPMTLGEVSAFIDKWCLAAELSLSKSQAQAEGDARIAADDLKERVRASSAIEKLARTPLLCSVICVIHRFLGQRIPERRVVLYEAMTNVLLYEWDRVKFPTGAAVAKLDAHAKRALLAHLACAMHEARVTELSANKVIENFAARLPDLGQSATSAKAIVEEIRDRSGVLVERTPGFFAFSHLTFQEYLTAAEIVNKRAYLPLLKQYKSSWWHEVIVLAAGFPNADASLMVQWLLSTDQNKVGMGTMLAAQCAETAVELPATLRNEIKERVGRLVPPKTKTDLLRLKYLGTLAGPVLLKGLWIADVNGKSAILNAMQQVTYEPAIGAIRRLMRDPSKPTKTLMNLGLPLANEALVALFMMAHDVDSAYVAFMEESALPNKAIKRRAIAPLIKMLSKHHVPRLSSFASSPPKPAARSD